MDKCMKKLVSDPSMFAYGCIVGLALHNQYWAPVATGGGGWTWGNALASKITQFIGLLLNPGTSSAQLQAWSAASATMAEYPMLASTSVTVAAAGWGGGAAIGCFLTCSGDPHYWDNVPPFQNWNWHNPNAVSPFSPTGELLK
jgi:hypothetical protein